MTNELARKPATIIDVAAACGVSSATVSRVFSGKVDSVASRTVERVREAAGKLGYSPSEIGRSLRLATTKIVVLLVPDASNDFCADVAVSIEQALQGRGLSMVLCNTGEDGDRQDRLLYEAQALRPHAIVLLGAIDTSGLREAAGRDRPVIFLNRRPPADIRAPYVGIDNFEAGRHVADYFLQKGYGRTAIIHGPRQYSASRHRLEGFVSRLEEAGFEPTDVLRVESLLTMEDGHRHGLELLSLASPPRAVFCGNDMIAYGIHRAAVEQGIRMPEDLAICGFDDNRINEWLAPWLTTVHVPALDFGAAVARILGQDRREKSATDVILPFSMKLRTSA